MTSTVHGKSMLISFFPKKKGFITDTLYFIPKGYMLLAKNIIISLLQSSNYVY